MGLRIYLIVVAAVCCGYTDGKESELCTKTNFSGEEKVFAVSLKNGTRLELEFTLDYTDTNTMNNSGRLKQSSHHVDFSSTTQQVVIRLKFNTKCKAETSTCSNSDMTISSLRHRRHVNPADVPVTVGKIDVVPFSHSPTKPRINTTILITDKGYYIEIVAEREGGTRYDPVKWFRPHNYVDYIPYQTTDLIYLTELPNLTAEICYTPDRCEGVCLSCPPGTVLQPHDSTVDTIHPNSTGRCNECGPGSYSVTENESVCLLCKPGRYNDKFSRTSCQECLSGSSSGEESRSTPCDKCISGMFAPTPGSLQCTECQPGSVAEVAVGAKKCTKCDIGSYTPGGSTQCNKCREGSVTPQPGAAECSVCDNGALNGTHCTCIAGTRRLSAGKCEGCGTGMYTPRDNMMECVECAGKVRSNNTCECPEGMELKNYVCVRTVCRPGQKMNLDGSCVTCHRGSYSREEDSKTCLECEPGFYLDEKGREKCKPCPKGTAQHLRGARWCMFCQMSGYQDAVGQSVCKRCRGTVNSANHTCHWDLFKCLPSTTYYPNIGTFSWPAASDDQLVTVECPYGGTAQRKCHKNRWLEPVLLLCNSEVSAEVNQLINKIKSKDEETAIKELKESVSQLLQRFGPRDIESITNAIGDTPVTNTKVATVKLEAALIMTDYNTHLQHVLDSSTKDRIVSIVDEAVGYLVDNGVKDLEMFSTEDVSIGISVNTNDTFSKRIDQEQIVSITQNATFSTVVYHNSKLFDVNKDSELLTSEVMSVKLHGVEVQDGFNIDLDMRVVVEGTAECRWYDTERSVWSTSGCHVTSRTGDLLHCQCNHLTSFAVFTSLSGIPEGHKQAQSILSTILFVISIIACVFTIVAYLPIRSLRRRLIVQVELMEITGLLLANITFLFLAHAQHQSTVCAGLVFGVQYLYLVTVAWSLVAAVIFYRQIVTAVHSYGKNYEHTFAISFLVCWILPLILPAFALIYSRQHGMSYVADLDGEFGCWISETWKTYTFILPILVVVFVNTVIGVKVIVVMLRAANTKNNKDGVNWDINKNHFKSILSLVMIFGTSFLLSLFTYGPHAIVFQYLFICFTCSQGLALFILFVPLRPEVHSEWKTIVGSGGSPLLSLNYSKTSSASTIISRRPSRPPKRRDSLINRCTQS